MSSKTFYLETFGCQMNVHDSEKVVGTLLHEGYRQVETVEEADLVLYNTCSIRDKAEQKVFNRLSDYKKYKAQGKTFGVLGCVAQQEGEKIFERAPYVSLVAGSASYRKLPEMLRQLEAAELESAQLEKVPPRETRSSAKQGSRGIPEAEGRKPGSLVSITGLDDRETDDCFETEFTARTNPHRGYITIIEGCDKFCSYCVVPYTRGKERSRTSQSVLAEARQMADLGYTEIQLLGQNVNSYKDSEGNFRVSEKTFAELLAAVGEVPGIRRVRFTTSHPRDFGRDIIDAIDAVPTLCDHVHLPVQSGSTRMLDAMQRLYTREQYLERIAWMKVREARNQHHHGYDRRLPGRDRSRFRRNSRPAGRSRLRRRLRLQIFTPPQHAVAEVWKTPSPTKKKPAAWTYLMTQASARFKSSSYKRYIGTKCEVMVEGKNEARAQWIGRTTHNKTLNFTAPPSANSQCGNATFQSSSPAVFPTRLLGELVV